MKSNHVLSAIRACASTAGHAARVLAGLAVVCGAMTLAGCTSLLTPLGAENYDCNRKENPSSPYCHSFRSAANGTNSDIPDSRYDAAVRISDVDRLAGIAPTGTGSDRDAASRVSALNAPGVQQPHPEHASGPYVGKRVDPNVGLGVQPEGAPVRVAPLVQRTWVKRHVEQGDRLVGSTYLYTEVARAHWQGYAESATGSGAREVAKPHLPPDDDLSAVRAASSTVTKTATGVLSRVRSSLSQPGVAAPAGDVVAPPIDGASMPQ